MLRLLLAVVCFLLIGCSATEEWGKTVLDRWASLIKLEQQQAKLETIVKFQRTEIEQLKENYKETGNPITSTEEQCLNYQASAKTIKQGDGSLLKDCAEIHGHGHKMSGVYWIQPYGSSPVKVFCEMTVTEGWTAILYRFNGSVDFNRKWADYKKGFGSASGENWIGNDVIHHLTNQKKNKLRVEFTYWTGGRSYTADYSEFKVESESNKYKLHVSGYTGNSAYDGLKYHNGRFFTTTDKDHDASSNNCAVLVKGGFWFGACHHANPTGLYQFQCTGAQAYKCMEWGRKPTKTMIMKIAPNQ